MTTYTEAELFAAVQAGYHAPDDLPLATRSWLEGYRAGRSTLLPVVPEGYVLLPVEPTEAMMDAFMGRAVKYGWELEVDSPRDGYKAMLSAGKEQQ